MKAADTTKQKNERVVRLKDELNKVLDLVVHSRQALENELSGGIAQKAQFIDKVFMSKLKDLSSCYNTLTDSRIRLDKAEASLEKDMTPEDEKRAVTEYIMAMNARERGIFLKSMVTKHNDITLTGATMTGTEVVDAD
jgi:hypothetical protein